MKQRGLYGADVVIGSYCVGLSSAYFVGALHEAPETQQILPPQHGRFVNRPYDLSGGTYPTPQNRPCAFRYAERNRQKINYAPNGIPSGAFLRQN